MHLKTKQRVLRALSMVVAFYALCGVGVLTAAPQAELWPRWQAHDATSRAVVDHSAWGEFLGRYLVPGDDSGVTLVRYGAVTSSDHTALKRYIESLAATPVSGLTRNEQFAYWVNLYNALTVDVILDRYPVASIREINISPGLFARGPWDAKLVTIESEEVSLNDIEHRILRPIWNDPRIHYAVNCASIGCPNLHPVPYTAGELEEILEIAAHAYINDPRGVTFAGARLQLSSIYDWFSEDFGDDIAAITAHLLEYAEGETRGGLEQFASGGHRGRVRHEYDWSLNNAPD